MNGWVILLIACVVLAAAKAVAQALHIGIYLAVVVGALTRPRETFGLLAVVFSAQLIQVQHYAFAGLFTVVTLAGGALATWRRP